MGHVKQDSMPVIRELSAFDRHSGNLLERLVFNHRALFMLAMTLATLVLGYMGATRLALAPSFEKMIPQSQPYIKTSWRTGTPCVASATRCGWWWSIPGGTSSTPTV